MAAAVENWLSIATESRGFHLVGGIARFERRTIEDHFGNRNMSEPVRNAGAHPNQLGAPALAQRDDLTLQLDGWLTNSGPARRWIS